MLTNIFFFIVKIKKNECSSLFDITLLLKHGRKLFSCEGWAHFNFGHVSNNILEIPGNNATEMSFKQEFYKLKI